MNPNINSLGDNPTARSSLPAILLNRIKRPIVRLHEFFKGGGAQTPLPNPTVWASYREYTRIILGLGGGLSREYTRLILGWGMGQTSIAQPQCLSFFKGVYQTYIRGGGRAFPGAYQTFIRDGEGFPGSIPDFYYRGWGGGSFGVKWILSSLEQDYLFCVPSRFALYSLKVFVLYSLLKSLKVGPVLKMNWSLHCMGTVKKNWMVYNL